MKKALFALLIFQLTISYITAQENKNEIELEEVELISSPRIEILNSENSINILTISKEEIKKVQKVQIQIKFPHKKN